MKAPSRRLGEEVVKRKSHRQGRRKQVILDDRSVHFRLCHFCLFLNESTQEVGQCKRCRRHLTFGAMLRDVTPEEVAEAWVNEGFEGTEEEAEDVAAEELGELQRNQPRAGERQFDPETQMERDVPHLNGLSVLW